MAKLVPLFTLACVLSTAATPAGAADCPPGPAQPMFPLARIQIGDFGGAVASGDFDADGRADLVTVGAVCSGMTPCRDVVHVLFGNGDGTFVPDADFSIERYVGVEVVDFDADTDLDIVLVSQECASSLCFTQVYILRNHGDGAFTHESLGSVRFRANAVAVADFDADGANDIALAGAGDKGFVLQLLLEPNGAVVNPPTTPHPLAGSPISLASGDIDGDGDIDLVIGADESGNGTPGLDLLLNTGAGEFVAGPQIASGVTPRWLDLADLDADLDLDVVYGHNPCTWQECPVSVRWLLNSGDAFVQAGEYTIPDDSQGGGVFDINADGAPDVIVRLRRALGVLIGDGHGVLAPPTLISPIASGSGPLVVVDVDSDTDLDIVTGTHILANAGDATFPVNDQYPPGSEPEVVALADLDADNDLDILTSGYRGTRTLLNDGNGMFTPTTPLPYNPNATVIAMGDLDADGDPDAVIASSGGSLALLNNTGDGVFSYRDGFVDFGNIRSADLADLDGDGDLDLIVGSQDPSVGVYINAGDGTFSQRVSIPVNGWPVLTAVGDVDADGDVDIATLCPTRSIMLVSILPNTGKGTFGPPRHIVIGPDDREYAYDALSLADLDGDDDLDVLAIRPIARTMTTLFNSGAGTFASPVHAPIETTAAALADLDADGDTDLATITWWREGLRTILNDGAGVFSLPAGEYWCPSPRDLALGDVNGDGAPDAIVVGDRGVTVMLNGGAPACCRADFNHDKTVNSTDVSDFVNAWFVDQYAGTLIADWDDNGVVNSTDVSEYINAWFEDIAAGCV